ncbi:MAG: HDIG domain-containing protein [Bacteroidales bacterium]|nr:HDIG domain-containing protein [Bacteroidales bacterium]MBR7168221.1 HDIG domain-containing protein [Bacteroidales bacterium]
MKKILYWLLTNFSLVYKVLAVLLVSFLILLVFPNQKKSDYDFVAGGFWNSEDLYAPFDFAVQKSQEEIDRDIATAKSDALLFFYFDSVVYSKVENQLLNMDWTLTNYQRNELLRLVTRIYSRGYLQLPDKVDINRTIVLLKGNVGTTREYNDFYSKAQINDLLHEQLEGYGKSDSLRIYLLNNVLQPNIVFDDIRTKLEEDSRLSQISSASGMVSMGQLIISKGEYITPEKANVLKSLEGEKKTRFDVNYSVLNRNIGLYLLIIIAFTALFLFLALIKHPLLTDNKKVTFVLFIIFLMCFMVAMLLRINPDLVMLAPLCLAPILVRVFFDMRVALYIHLVIIIIIASFVPNSFEFIFYQLIAGMMSIISVKNFEHRSNFFVVSLIVFLTYSAIYVAGVLSQDTTLENVNVNRFLIFFCNALLLLMAFPFTYLFEKIFGFVSVLTLLEISSTNTKALRDLSNKAPGTFQHSVQVANIAEDMINEIGGDSLLARVGALYHDIGKMYAPLYFTENQTSGFNPHAELESENSASIIIAHVRNGVEMAKKYHLPEGVIDFIRTHHGTTKTGYFYNRYIIEHPDEPVDEALFAYNGPKPYSRETAVVMLVDSVEAAVRSLNTHDKESISSLIDRIVEGKIRDNQFSNCNITFRDIDTIKRILKDKMLSIYHVRIAYPVVDGSKGK